MNSEKIYEERKKFPVIFVQKMENPFNFVQQNTNWKFFEKFVPFNPGLPGSGVERELPFFTRGSPFRGIKGRNFGGKEVVSLFWG